MQRPGRIETIMAGRNVPATIPAGSGEAGLNRYLAEIKKFPILTPEEEYMLAKRWTEHQDTDAAALGFVHPVTKARLSFKSALPSDIQELFGALTV